jgi:hypothetical protein
MNGTHLMVIGLTAAALLDLHATSGSLFLVMASAAQTPSPNYSWFVKFWCKKFHWFAMRVQSAGKF